jgi:hypothetical protein
MGARKRVFGEKVLNATEPIFGRPRSWKASRICAGANAAQSFESETLALIDIDDSELPCCRRWIGSR